MIGTDLNLDLPSLADSLATIVSKTTTALSLIEDSIADKATPAALNINTNLSIGGNHLTNIGGLVLVAGNAPVAAGSIYYSGGNFYAKDATGVIQLTAAGAINLSATGAIGGDYGSGPESFTYDLPSQEFRAKASPTVWADLACDDLVLMEDSGPDYVRLRAPAAMGASYSVMFPSAPPATPTILQMNASGDLVTSNALTGNVSTTGTIAATGNITGAKLKHTGTETLIINAGATGIDSTGVSHTKSADRWTLNNNFDPIWIPLPVEQGMALTHLEVRIRKVSNAGCSLRAELFKTNVTTGVKSSVAFGTYALNATGYVDMGFSLSEAVDFFHTYHVEFKATAGTPTGDQLLGFGLNYTKP